MGFQVVAFLPSLAGSSTTFLKNSCMDESLRTYTCFNTVVGVGMDMLPVKHFLSSKSFFCLS